MAPSKKAERGFPNLRMLSLNPLGNILIVYIVLNVEKRSKWPMMIGGVCIMVQKC